MLFEESLKSVLVHFIWNTANKDLQLILVVQSQFLLLSQQLIFLTLDVLELGQRTAFLKIDSLVFRSMPLQLFAHHFSQIPQLLRYVEHHPFLVLIFMHAPDLLIEVFRELFPQEIPDIFQGIKLNIHV